MTISTYGELRTAIANELMGRTDLTNRIIEWIAAAEQRTYTRLRVRFMEASDTIATVTSTRTSALPLRWLQGRSLYVSGSPVRKLVYKSPAEYWALHANRTEAKPSVYTIEGDSFEWGPVPDGAYAMIANYYKRPASMSADADTNGLFTLSPNLLKYAAMIDASTYIGHDSRAMMWATLWGNQIDELMESDRRDRASGDLVPEDRMAQVT